MLRLLTKIIIAPESWRSDRDTLIECTPQTRYQAVIACPSLALILNLITLFGQPLRPEREVQQVHCENEVHQTDLVDVNAELGMQFVLAPCLRGVFPLTHGFVQVTGRTTCAVHRDCHVNSIVSDVLGIFQDA